MMVHDDVDDDNGGSKMTAISPSTAISPPGRLAKQRTASGGSPNEERA
jgi:hypothetical protein